jgi:hypothetical protein
MTTLVNWIQNKPHTLHCHLKNSWTVGDLQTLATLYQARTAHCMHPFNLILTAEGSPRLAHGTHVLLPIHPAQATLIVVNAHTFFDQLTDSLVFTPSSSMTVFVGSWSEATHFADGVA